MIIVQVWKFMRTSLITKGKTECLSIRIRDVPGLDDSIIGKIDKMLLDDKSKGFRSDRRFFLTRDTPTQGSKLTQVRMQLYST